MPLETVTSSNPPPQIAKQRKSLIIECHESDIRQAVVINIAEVYAHPRDELAVLRQCDARSKATSSNFPPPLLWNSQLHIVSFVTNKSTQPSRS